MLTPFRCPLLKLILADRHPVQQAARSIWPRRTKSERRTCRSLSSPSSKPLPTALGAPGPEMVALPAVSQSFDPSSRAASQSVSQVPDSPARPSEAGDAEQAHPTPSGSPRQSPVLEKSLAPSPQSAVNNKHRFKFVPFPLEFCFFRCV